MSDLGKAKKITVDKDNNTIVESKGKHPEIEGRVKEIPSQIDKTTSDYDREKLQNCKRRDRFKACRDALILSVTSITVLTYFRG